jgi:hypothetical protein
MPHMPYSRRARLVGSSLSRPAVVSIRGDRRRLDAQGTIPTPYFDGLPTSGATLTVQHTTTSPASATVSLTSPSGIITLTDVLSQINAGLIGINVHAVDNGGCIGLVSAAASQGSCILEVTGGTAAAALGFDLAKQSYSARSGDLASAPEGGIENAFGAALPTKGENFTTDTMARALGRVMANTDVLASEEDREEVHIQKVGRISGPSVDYGATGRIALSRLSLSPGASYQYQRIYTAAWPQTNKVLSATSTAKELAPYFTLVDAATGKVSSAVVGVLDNTPANVLGVASAVITDAAIVSIPSGDTISIGSTTGIWPGDYAEIKSATNGKWRNNGMRWVIEQVVSSTNLKLRPMSAKELEVVGVTVPSDLQPIVELSTEKAGGESFGSVTVWHSNFRHFSDLTLVVEPNIADASSSIDVYAAVPASKRTRTPHQFVDSLNALHSRIASSDSVGTVTVGAKGRFHTLVEAVSWVNLQATSSPDRWEILVLDDQEIASKIPVTGPNTGFFNAVFVTIRGITGGTKLRYQTGATSFTYFGLNRAHLTLANITVTLPDRAAYKVASGDGGTTDATVELLNVRLPVWNPGAGSTVPWVAYEFQDLPGNLYYSASKTSGGTGVSSRMAYINEEVTLWSNTQSYNGATWENLMGSAGFVLPTAAGTSPETSLRLVDSRYPGADATLSRSQIRTLVGGPAVAADSLHTHVGIGGGGTVGPAGPTGPAGPKGDQGIQGPKGDTGSAGAASTVPGPTGPAGPIGTIYWARISPDGSVAESSTAGFSATAGADFMFTVNFPAAITTGWAQADASFNFKDGDSILTYDVAAYKSGAASLGVRAIANVNMMNSYAPAVPSWFYVWGVKA